MNKRNRFEKIRLESVVDKSPQFIFWKDIYSTYLGCNENFARIAGLESSQDIVGKTDYDLPWANSSADIYINEDKDIVNSGRPLEQKEVSLLTAENKEILVVVSKTPLFDDKKNIIGIMGIYMDITERKKIEQKLAKQIKKTEKAYRSKAEYLTTASHEIRNPVSVVESIVKNILKSQLNNLQDIFCDHIIEVLKKAEKSDYIEVIAQSFQGLIESCCDAEKAAQHALDALKNLNDLHNLHVKGAKIDWEPYGVAELIKKSITKIKHSNIGQLMIEQKISPSIPKVVVLDYENIHKALIILIGNAIRFSYPANRIKIIVDTISEQNCNFLVISIQDFGPGISEAQMQHLFASVLNEDEIAHPLQYTKPSVQLPQAKMRIEASGGSLSLTSTLHIGTTVVIKVPYRALSIDEQIKTTQLPEKSILNKNAAFTKYSLLLVEDDEITQKTTAKVLKDFGYQVDIAGKASDAIKLAIANNYDLIIMDITLPDINGLVATQQIHQNNDGNVPVIGLTSHATEEDTDNCLNAGMILVLNKPFTKEALKRSIENVLYEKANEKND